MFGKKKFSAFPELKSEKARSPFKLSPQTKLIILSTIVLFPAGWFWSSVILRLALGTDYFFDVYFERLSDTTMGNIILVIAIIFLPGITIGLNGIGYIERKEKISIVTMIIAGFFLAIGFLAVLNRG